MKKKRIIKIGIIVAIIVFVLGFSIFNMNSEDGNKLSNFISSMIETVNINNLNLDVNYIDGKEIDSTLTYGNKLENVIEIENKNENDVAFAIKFDNASISNDKLTYSIYISNDDKNHYQKSLDNVKLTGSSNLGYNLVVGKKSKMFVKLVFLSNLENEETIIKGDVKVISNLSDKDVFFQSISDISNNLDNLLSEKNGITSPGIYTLSLDELDSNVRDGYNGFIAIDASDIANINYHFTIWNDKLMLNNYNYTKNKISKNSIEIFNNDYVSGINKDTVCSNLTKKGCLSLDNISYSQYGGKENFLKYSKVFIDYVESNYKSNGNVVIYDITTLGVDNPSGMFGYILVDGTKQIPEYYIYIANGIFMVSGYNYTKLGAYTANSATIRAYNQTAFALSARDMVSVCMFTNVGTCYTADGIQI